MLLTSLPGTQVSGSVRILLQTSLNAYTKTFVACILRIWIAATKKRKSKPKRFRERFSNLS